jgi:CBS domain-containing protein
MANTRIAESADLTVADVLHEKFSALPVTATIGDVRDWFAASDSRRMAFLADGARYAGSIPRERVSADVDPSSPAADVALDGPTVPPEASAVDASEIALQTDARRVPVVDHDGRLLGVVSVAHDLTSFCGT